MSPSSSAPSHTRSHSADIYFSSSLAPRSHSPDIFPFVSSSRFSNICFFPVPPLSRFFNIYSLSSPPFPIRRSRFPAAHGSAPYKLPRREPCIPSRTEPVERNARGFFSFFSCARGKRTVLPHKKERFPFSQRETVFFFIYSRRRRHTRNADSARWAP